MGMKERSKSSKVMFLCFMIMCFGMGMWNSVIYAEAYDGVSGFYQWEYNDNGKGITITKYTGGEINITMPSKINGKSVTVIGRGAFHDNDWMESVKIPTSVKEILAGAFWDCDELKSINIPDSVTNIESTGWDREQTFGNCDNLKLAVIGKMYKEYRKAVLAEVKVCHQS